MRIGIDVRLWNETGVGRYIRNLVKELAKIDKTNQYILFFRQSEFETVPLPGKNFEKRLADIRWHTIEEQTKLPKILLSENLDLMHFPYFSYPIWYKKPFVITIHDLIIDHFPTGKASTLPQPLYHLKQLGYKYVLSQAVKHAKKIIAVSKATKQEIMEHYHSASEKVMVTYEGIDEAVSKKDMEAVDVKRPYFLYVGNAYPHKNLERLIQGFAEFLHSAHEDAYLILVGKEDYFYTRLKEIVKEKNLQNHIFFYQHISDHQLAFLYHQALALVLPSLMEGFGLPAIEAMENNCLVLASDIPAFLEVCGSSAEYFDPMSTHDIARVLQKAFDHTIEDVKIKKEQGQKQVKRFSWQKMAKETLSVYESCVSVR